MSTLNDTAKDLDHIIIQFSRSEELKNIHIAWKKHTLESFKIVLIFLRISFMSTIFT